MIHAGSTYGAPDLTYLYFGLGEPGDGGEGLLRFDVRVLCDGEGPLQLVQLRLAERGALPAALHVSTHRVETHCKRKRGYNRKSD